MSSTDRSGIWRQRGRGFHDLQSVYVISSDPQDWQDIWMKDLGNGPFPRGISFSGA